MEEKIKDLDGLSPEEIKQGWQKLIDSQNQSPFANGDYVVKPTEKSPHGAQGKFISVTKGGENWELPAAPQTFGQPKNTGRAKE